MAQLLADLLLQSAQRSPDAPALRAGSNSYSYSELAAQVRRFAAALRSVANIGRSARVGVWLDKRLETVVALFGTAHAGAVFVPINPLLKAEQAAYIARDCNVEVLVTTAQRYAGFASLREQCPDLRQVVLVDGDPAALEDRQVGRDAEPWHWTRMLEAADAGAQPHRVIDADMAGILYTSGSTGKPKGVVLSHRNIVAGAHSVSTYLGNTAEDRILAALPLSFDYGLSQLTTAFLVGASAVLHNYLLPQDAIRAMARERITGLAAVPPLWLQLATLDWPPAVGEHLRYFTNSGGAMPTTLLADLRKRAPRAKPFLMYGLTEAFRSTYLPPEEVDRRPTPMGKAIPNAEILVVREDGSECAPGEPGELVHRGALVSMGYWNDPEKTAERFKPVPGQRKELVLTELAVWSGDTVKKDDEGFLYFVSRRDEMIKTSGYRVSPTEIEEVVYRSGLVAEVAAFGVDHPALGQAIVLVAHPAEGMEPDSKALLEACKAQLPAYMQPQHIDWLSEALPRNANGKIDRKSLSSERAAMFASSGTQAEATGVGA
ncbi:MAG TPA: acyl-CoA ligase (AMP-forming), exosortase A system-associated [Burkholderiaceae bacterium]|nr:acyl-CoA ligase (AMP-forming), exosortase A system-associated [Burkholderiaceae bacterium]